MLFNYQTFTVVTVAHWSGKGGSISVVEEFLLHQCLWNCELPKKHGSAGLKKKRYACWRLKSILGASNFAKSGLLFFTNRPTFLNQRPNSLISRFDFKQLWCYVVSAEVTVLWHALKTRPPCRHWENRPQSFIHEDFFPQLTDTARRLAAALNVGDKIVAEKEKSEKKKKQRCASSMSVSGEFSLAFIANAFEYGVKCKNCLTVCSIPSKNKA